MTEKELRTIVAHPFLALAREFQWDDRQLEAANKLIDITTIRLFEGGLAVPPAPSGAPDDLRAIAAFCRQTARDHINPSMAWFVETANAIEAALAGGVAAPAPSAPQLEKEK